MMTNLNISLTERGNYQSRGREVVMAADPCLVRVESMDLAEMHVSRGPLCPKPPPHSKPSREQPPGCRNGSGLERSIDVILSARHSTSLRVAVAGAPLVLFALPSIFLLSEPLDRPFYAVSTQIK